MIATLSQKTFNAGFTTGTFRFAIVTLLTCFAFLLAAPVKLLAQTVKTSLPNQTVVCAGTSTITLTASAEHPNKTLVVKWQKQSNGSWTDISTGIANKTERVSNKELTTSSLTLSGYSNNESYRVAFGVNSVDPATANATAITSTAIIIPSANFTMPAEVFAGNNINLTFTGSASANTSTKYQWTISDGTSVPAVANPSINFATPGLKTITLTLTDGGCTVLAEKTIRVHGNYTWNGNKSVDWFDAANWTPSLVPGAADNVTINTAPFPPVLSANTSIKNLTLNTETLELGTATLTVKGNTTINGGRINGGTLATAGNILTAGNNPVHIYNVALIGSDAQVISTSNNATPVFNNLTVLKTDNTVSLETNVTVNGTLNLNNTNKLVLGNSNLLIGATGNIISGKAGYVVTNGLGTLQMTVANNEAEVFFPVGNHSYNPVKIKQKTTGTTDIFKIRVKGGLFVLYDADNNGIDPAVIDGVSRTWVIEETVKGGSQAQVTLQFSATNNVKDWAPEFTPEKAVMAQFTENWAAPTTGSATVAPDNSNLLQVSLDHLSSFRIFGVFNYDHQRLTTLPVELVNFKAARTKGEVELKWQTAMEKNNDFFTVEMSLDGKRFSEVAKVKGVGNTNQIQSYSYLHRNAPSQTTYYRLKQTDFDGTFTYSKVISVNNNAPLTSLVVYPNPGTGPFTLQGATNVTEALIFDATGRMVKKLSVLDKEINFDLSGEQAGIYFLRLTGPAETQTLRLIKK
ncbi:MAG: T9SS type A sorting domain-containing protein [Adhaeribacter sp.]